MFRPLRTSLGPSFFCCEEPPEFAPGQDEVEMKVVNSLKSLKKRHRDCRIVRRKGRVYVINKTNRRFKARQG